MAAMLLIGTVVPVIGAAITSYGGYKILAGLINAESEKLQNGIWTVLLGTSLMSLGLAIHAIASRAASQ